MSAADKKFSPDRYAPLYNKVLSDILYITYNIFPELEEHKASRTPPFKASAGDGERGEGCFTA
ncbi:MAG: hypothetical protein AB2L14_02240 [Candidatus Xenobiia bacterium LiM19]